MSTPRPVIAGRTVFVTRCCTQRQFLLQPDEATKEALLYCLGVAAQDFGVELHWFYAALNHLHAGYTDHFRNLPDFLAYFHQLVAKTVNAIRGRRENLWATEQTSVVECVEPEDAFGEMIYSVTNPAKDHLVDRSHLWPGVNSLTWQLVGKEITVKRPRKFFNPDGSMPKEVTLRFTRPPGFDHLSQDEWVAKVKAAVTKVEDAAAKERAELKIGVLGVDAIKKQKPTDSPSSPRDSGRINPRVACKNPSLRIETLQRNKQWLADYRAALTAYREGDKLAPFPFGTWQLRVDTHVQCAPGPGPLAIPYALTLCAA